MESTFLNLGDIKNLVEEDFIVVSAKKKLAEVVEEAQTNNFSYCFIADPNGCISTYIPMRKIWLAAREIDQQKEPSLDSLAQNCPEKLDVSTDLISVLKILQKTGHRVFPVMDKQEVVGYLKIDEAREYLINKIIYTNSKLEERSKQLKQTEDFTNIVSHDLRNPLGVISICCNYLLSLSDEDEENLSPLQNEFIKRILNNSTRALSLVQSLLELAKAKSGAALNISKVEAVSYLTNIVYNFKYLAKEKNIDIVLEPSEDMEICLDTLKFGQVLENLLANAIKFSPRGKKIYLACSTADDLQAQFTIRDEGPGIPKEKQQTLFKKFEQGEEGKDLGAGLGLFIVEQFVKLHKGRIEVSNNSKGGSTFTVFIPRGLPLGNTSKLDLIQSPIKKRLKVLAVEDDDDIREYVVSALKDHGLEVVQASAGDSAFRLFCENSVDLVVSDLRIPELDGFELLQKIKNIKPNLPYILITGCYDHINDDKAKNIFHADTILHKPFLGEDLQDAIEAVLADKQEPR